MSLSKSCALFMKVSVLEEAKIMIPDTRQRLEGALQDLTGYVVGSLNYSTASRALPVL